MPQDSPGLSWRAAFLCGLAVLAIPALIGQGHLTKRAFNEEPVRRLERSHPEGVLLGDSMLETRIDASKFSKLAHTRWEALGYAGSGTAHWYLVLKNIVAAQPTLPRAAIILYRDRQLTLPQYHVEGRNRPRLEALMHASEPEVETRIETVAGQASGLERWASRLYPLQSHRLEWQDKMQRLALQLGCPTQNPDTVTDAAAHTFDVRRLRADAGAFAEGEETASNPLDPPGHIFSASVGQSFLPLILDLARRKQLRLIFFRVKHKPLRDGSPVRESVELKAYQAELQTYLQNSGVTLIDETPDSAIDLSYYGGDDHVKESMMGPYTEVFWRRVASVVTSQH